MSENQQTPSTRAGRAASPVSTVRARASPTEDEQQKPDKETTPNGWGDVEAIKRKHSLHLWLLFFNRLASAVMRMAMGPLVVYICEDVPGCEISSKGQLMSAFSLGYVATQIPGGILADRFGCRDVIFVATLGAGICTALTPDTAAFGGVTGMVAIQVLMGALQGPLFPASIGFMAAWLPSDQRTWAATLLDGGISMGSLIALPLSGRLVNLFGWRGVFRLYGIATIMYAGAWFMLAEDVEHLLLDKSAAKDKASSKSARSTPWALLVRAPVLAIFFAHAMFNFGTYFLTSWPPTYYADILGVRPEDAVVDFMLPPLCNLGVNCVSTLAFKRVRASLSHTSSRKLFTGFGFVAASWMYLFVSVLRGTTYARILTTVGFSVANGLVGLHPCGFKANYMEISVSSAGIVSGVGNTIASAASFLGPLYVAYVLKSTDSWSFVFLSVAVAQCTAALVYATLGSTEPQDVTKEASAKTD